MLAVEGVGGTGAAGAKAQETHGIARTRVQTITTEPSSQTNASATTATGATLGSNGGRNRDVGGGNGRH